jgi:hypothetical protein
MNNLNKVKIDYEKLVLQILKIKQLDKVFKNEIYFIELFWFFGKIK